MRKADIVLGDDYASSRSQSGYGYGVRRVKILEVGVERKTRYGSRYRNATTADGVRVQYLRDDGSVFNLNSLRSTYDYPEVLRSQNIKSTWDKYQLVLDQRTEAREWRKVRAKEEHDRLVIIVAAANAKVGQTVFMVIPGRTAETMPYLIGNLDEIAEALAT